MDPELLRQLAADPTTGFVIDLREQADLSPAYGMSWDARGRFVVDALREVAEKTQPALRERLAREGVPFEPFWIANRIVVESGSPDLLLSLLDQPEILAIRALPRVALVPAPPDEPDSLLAPGWNIAMVRAPEAWGMGVTGEGIVVAIVDTGVRATHEALRTHYRGWDGGSYRHDYSFFDPGGLCGGVPCDFNGHGTHVTGSAVGDDGAANQIGVAPGAEWIACNAHCCPTCGSCLDGGWLRACLQWLLAPTRTSGGAPDPGMRPHVVNNSWGGEGHPTAFHLEIDALRAAGIYPVFANGNQGFACGSVANPASYGRVTGVGAIGSDGTYRSFSNQGPSTFAAPPEEANGFPFLKPNLSAPGNAIESASADADDSYTTSSGTSMAAPHVAGLVALLWSACPDLIGDYPSTLLLMEDTAARTFDSQCPAGGAPDGMINNSYGFGRIDALDAVNAALAWCQQHATRDLSVARGGDGAGTVASSPAGIACGDECRASFAHGSSVTLTPAPAPGSAFAGWAGDGCSGAGACAVPMHEDREVVAVFACMEPPAEFLAWFPGPTDVLPATSSTTDLFWDPAANATSYEVYFGTSDPPPHFATTSYTGVVVPVAAGHRYYWQVRARGAACGSRWNLGGRMSFAVDREPGDGSVDQSFQPEIRQYGTIESIVVQPDGRILIGGDFALANDVAAPGIARLHPDGSTDPTFSAMWGSGAGAMVLQPDGRIVVNDGGSLVRLQADGAVDGGFGVGQWADGVVSSLALQPDGRIVVGGAFTSYSGEVRSNIARLRRDGTLDPTFAAGGAGPNAEVLAIALQPDGRILIGGYFTEVAGVARARIARLHPDGSLDQAFDPGAGPNGRVTAIALQPDGRILVGGSFSLWSSQYAPGLVRLDTHGAMETAGPGWWMPAPDVRAIALQPDGRPLVAGAIESILDQPRGGLVRLTPDLGSEDAGFVARAWAVASVNVSLALPDETVFIAGRFSSVNGILRRSVASLRPDGSLAPSSVLSPIFGEVWDAALQGDGRIVIGGRFTALAPGLEDWPASGLARVETSGALDGGFLPLVSGRGADGIVFSVEVLPDDRVIAGGWFHNVNGVARRSAVRLNGDGSLDSGFDPGSGADGGAGVVRALLSLPDGKVVVGGSFVDFAGVERNGIARLLPDGSLDSGFSSGSADALVEALRASSDGGMLVGGSFASFAGLSRSGLVRLHADGSADPAFFPGPGVDGSVSALAGTDTGREILGGWFSEVAGQPRDSVAWVSGATGSLDPSLDVGRGAMPEGVASLTWIASGQRLLVGGPFLTWSGFPRRALVRLETSDPEYFAPIRVVKLGIGEGHVRALPGGIDCGDTCAWTYPAMWVELDATPAPGSTFLGWSGHCSGFGPCRIWSRAGGGKEKVAIAHFGCGLLMAPFDLSSPPQGASLPSASSFVELSWAAVPGATDYDVYFGTDEVPDLWQAGVPGTTLTVPVASGRRYHWRVHTRGGCASQWNGGGTRSFEVAAAHAGPGRLDPTFAPTLLAAASVRDIALLSGGELLIAGSFSTVNDQAMPAVARLLPFGSTHWGFDSPFTEWVAYRGNSLVVYPDGSSLVTGVFAPRDGTDATSTSILRLRPDGSLDRSFTPVVTDGGQVFTAALQDDGRILIGGTFTMAGPDGPLRGIARLLPDGGRDESFSSAVEDGAVYAILVQKDLPGPVIGGSFTRVGGETRNRVAMLTPEGALWPGFAADLNGPVYALARGRLRDLFVAGGFTSAGGFQRNRIALLDALFGTVDPDFDTALDGTVYSLARSEDDGVFVAGAFATADGLPRRGVAQLSRYGVVSPAFDPASGADGAVRVVRSDGDGGVLVGGDFLWFAGQPRYGLARLDASGALQPEPLAFLWRRAEAAGAAIEPDSRLVIGGTFRFAGGGWRDRIARLDLAGLALPGFVPGTDNTVATVELQADGRAVAGGAFTSAGGSPRARIARFTTAGAIDSSFDPGSGANGMVYWSEPDPAGNLLIAGDFTAVDGVPRNSVARLMPSGAVDPSFDPGSALEGTAYVLEQQPDGRILVGGRFVAIGGGAAGGIARLLPDGSLDPAFDLGSPVTGGDSRLFALALQPDGKIVIGGGFHQVGSHLSPALARLHPNGQPDTSFHSDFAAGAFVSALELVAENKLVTGGYVPGVRGWSLFRLTGTGAIDPAFDRGGGMDGWIDRIRLLPDGRLLVAGAFWTYNGHPRRGLAIVTDVPAALITDGFEDGSLARWTERWP